MNNQEAFDTVARHLFKQGRQAIDNYECQYRAADGGKCAVGVLIPDYLYSPDMEGKGSATLLNKYLKVAAHLSDVDPLLLSSLQHTHDAEIFWETTGVMRNRLYQVAREHQLDGSIVDTLSFEDR